MSDEARAASQRALGNMRTAVEDDGGHCRILWTCDEPKQVLITARSKNGRPFLVAEYVRHGGFEVFVPVTEANDLEVTTAALKSYVSGVRKHRALHIASALDAIDEIEAAVKAWDHVVAVLDPAGAHALALRIERHDRAVVAGDHQPAARTVRRRHVGHHVRRARQRPRPALRQCVIEGYPQPARRRGPARPRARGGAGKDT